MYPSAQPLTLQKIDPVYAGSIVAMDCFLGEQGVHRLSLNQFSWLVEMVVYDGVGGDSKTVIDCGQQLGRMYRVLVRCAGSLIGLAVNLTTLDTRAANHCSVAVGPMVATVGVVVVTACLKALLRATAKFTDTHYHRAVQHAPLIEVCEQAGEALVEHRGGLSLHSLLKALVNVP